MIILDTNVVSELVRPEPAERVVHWLGSQRASAVATTSITVAEVMYGLRRLPAGRRRESLVAAAREVFDLFSARILPFDADSARNYADVTIERADAGLPISGFDAQIAAICRTNGCALATRNTSDFVRLGLDLVDPFEAGS
jgi:predicted nucleic acid-binding protein